jgi:hypothetical protein
MNLAGASLCEINRVRANDESSSLLRGRMRAAMRINAADMPEVRRRRAECADSAGEWLTAAGIRSAADRFSGRCCEDATAVLGEAFFEWFAVDNGSRGRQS